MTELLLDTYRSEEVITLDKPNLFFNIEPAASPDQNGIFGKSECTITVKNKTSSNVAVRTKTTKKDVYAVNPTYGVILPEGLLEIKFVYYIKDLNEDPKKHKFKFEGVILEKPTTEKDVKALFESLIINKIKVKGSAIKREVSFNYIKKEQPVIETNLPENVQEPEIMPNAKSSAIPSRQNGNDKQAETQLQDLKLELHKYKNQLNSLVETHRNLKNRVEMEKTKDIQSNLNFTVSTSEEKQVSKKIAISLFIISIFLGFILSR